MIGSSDEAHDHLPDSCGHPWLFGFCCAGQSYLRHVREEMIAGWPMRAGMILTRRLALFLSSGWPF